MISYARLWKLLEKRGYSQRDIMHLAGISESTYRMEGILDVKNQK